jgi:hypothetical protein
MRKSLTMMVDNILNQLTNGGSLNYLLDIQRKDKIKTEYCKINGIRLVRINYKQKSVDNILNCEDFKNRLENT